MSTKGIAASRAKAAQEVPSELLEQYGCGPIQFMGTDGLYERHLHFDNIIDEKFIGPRGRFEAVARSVRDVLSQRWVLTDKTYEQNNPKRVYYLSMEFLLGRSLVNNVTNLVSPENVKESELAGEPIIDRLTCAPGNKAPLGGLKVVAASGWFAARPSGTENVYKIYAESFRDQPHLDALVKQAQQIVDNALL